MIRRQKDYPRQLQIGENIWDVRFCRQIPGEPTETLGMCDPAELTIFIRLRQTPTERFKTAIHEFLHAIEFEYKIEIPHALVHNLEEPLVRLFVDNGVIL